MKILKNVKNNIGILVIALPFAILFIALLAIQTKSIYRGTIYDII